MRTTKYMVLPFIGVVILCVCCISYFTYQDSKDIILRATEKSYRFVLLEVANNIEQRVTKVLESAQIAAQGATVKAALIEGGKAPEVERRRELARSWLDTINGINMESSSLALLNARGAVVIDSEGVLKALLPSLGSAAESASPLGKVRSGSPYVGVQMDPQSKNMIIYGLVPVFNKGTYLGAVFTSMNMENFAEVWALPLVTLAEVRLTLLDNKRDVILCSDDYFTAGMNFLHKYETDDLFNTLGELLTLRADGLRVGMHWQVPAFDWSLTIGVERSVLLAPAMKLLRNTFVISTVSGLLTIFGTVFIFRSMQRRLRKSDDALAQTITAASIATWEWDSGQGGLRVNRFFNRMLGYDEGQTEYSSGWCLEHLHPVDRKMDGDRLLSCAEQLAYNQECRLKNVRGEWHWVRSFGSVTVDRQSGKVQSGKGILVDIQARKEADAARERQQQRLEVLVNERTAALQESNSIILRERALLDSVLNSIPDIIYYKDTGGRYVGCNMACAILFGIAMEDMIGKTDAELGVFSLNTLQRIEERDQQAYLSHGPYWYEQTMDFRDGKVITFETVKKIFYNEHGGIQGLVGISRNITERKKVEEDLMRARQQANAANQAKSEFLANMSHEIRTPLNGIMGLNYLAMQEEPAPHIMEYLKKISSSAQNLSLIVNDILDFSKIEAGKLDLDYSAFSLQDIVQSTFDMLHPQADKKGIALQVENLDTVPPALMGDPLRLNQVLLNLLSNAIKFTHQGTVTLRLEVKSHTEKAITLNIQVHDTGIGMTAEQISRLFTAFTQADASTTRQYGGTGLGLAICKSIIDLMGGSISVSSVPGQGSCFAFSLPLDIAEDGQDLRLEQGGAQPAAMVAEALGPAAGNMLQGVRVLLAEDNDINQVIAQELLQSMGCIVDIADDGQEAINKALTKDYDIILMDIQMPVMDGFSATRELRSHMRMQNVPIIAMTAHAMVSDKEKSLAVGMQDHITKPIDPATLEQTVLRWVMGAGQAGPV